jgi:hypothetical protein
MSHTQVIHTTFQNLGQTLFDLILRPLCVCACVCVCVCMFVCVCERLCSILIAPAIMDYVDILNHVDI